MRLQGLLHARGKALSCRGLLSRVVVARQLLDESCLKARHLKMQLGGRIKDFVVHLSGGGHLRLSAAVLPCQRLR